MNQKLKLLVAETENILKLAEQIQDNTKPIEVRETLLEELRKIYHRWYGEALSILNLSNQKEKIEDFKKYYEKDKFLSRTIPSFLNNGLEFDKEWVHPFKKRFKTPFLCQRDILLTLTELNVFSEYVNNDRIQELRSLQPSNFDLSRLIKLCEELNSAHINKNYLSIALLIRAIIDHVPPIFNVSNFSQVANNYSTGTKSFKDHMKNLDDLLRKLSDSYLHTHIRQKEVLPNETQVNFSASLDFLLSEIIRILK
jgi:hypothetical protein